MSKYRFAVGLYSVRNELSKDLTGTLNKVKEMGYEGVEFFGALTYKAEDVTNALLQAGLTIVGWHTPWNAVQEDTLDETIAFFKAIGNKNVIIPGLPEHMLATKESCLETARQFNEISEKLAVHGMRIGYHNHSSEMAFFKGTAECPFTVFFDETNSDVIVQMDNGNALSGGGPGLISLLKRYPNRYKTIHLKPYSLEKGAVNSQEGFETMIGEDDIPWMEFMYICSKTGGTEWFIVEYESEKMYPELEGIDKSLQALSDMEKSGMI